MFSPPQIFNLVSADFFSHSLTVRLKAINLFKYLDIIQVVFFFPFSLCQEEGDVGGTFQRLIFPQTLVNSS